MEKIIIVPGSISFEDRVALGNYNGRSKEISREYFPYNPQTIGKWEVVLIGTGEHLAPCDAYDLCCKDGLEPLRHEHLLSFGSTYPDEQKRNPIIALSYVCEMHERGRLLSLTYSDRLGRYLDLEYSDCNCFSSTVRYLAGRRIS